ncbi:MAG TPA: dihydropyrimidinase [Candidatus Caenarcaniphilales bacterium]|nr:dihydropyrimidinase [Candidatus Caenarcaniphilales bacterium]
MLDLVIRGGTVVSAAGSRPADVGVSGGRIEAIRGELGSVAGATEVDASGLLLLPGIVDVHTHTRVASDAEPDRFFQDSVAAAFGGTTTFLCFNNPGTGVSSGGGSLLADLHEWRSRTEGDSAVDYGLSLVLTADHATPELELPAVIEAGVPTFKAFMVYEFGVSDATLYSALATAARHGGMLQVHCENRTLLEANTRRLLGARQTAPRYHAASRPPLVEAEATHRAIRLAEAADAPLYVVHLSSAEALEQVRWARRRGLPVYAETCPHYLALDESRYELPDEDAARFVISPPLRSPMDQAALWQGLAEGDLSIVATDHVPDRVAIEKQSWHESFDRISNGGPGIETLLTVVHSQGVAGGRIGIERLVDLLSTTPARLFGLPTKGALEVGRDADIVLFDPAATRAIRAGDLHHTSDYTPYEGLRAVGAVRSVFVRGQAVVRDGAFVGQRGYGRFVERSRPALT